MDYRYLHQIPIFKDKDISILTNLVNIILSYNLLYHKGQLVFIFSDIIEYFYICKFRIGKIMT